MDINFSYGFYDTRGQLYQISANLNTNPEYYKQIKNVLNIKRPKDLKLVRVGLQNRDGGYVMSNCFKENGIAYSFGICNDVSWDTVMAELGYNIYMYDHTINSLPYTRKEFHFFKEGISGKNEEKIPLKTLEYYINKNGHENNENMILKMDVEGAEWEFLDTVKTKTLEQFDQIVFEYHKIVQAGFGDKVLKLLKKINKTHQLIHLHGNNSGFLVKIGDTVFPDVLEATYVKRGICEFTDDECIKLPINLDAPNDIGRPDVILGEWNKPLIID